MISRIPIRAKPRPVKPDKASTVIHIGGVATMISRRDGKPILVADDLPFPERSSNRYGERRFE